METRLMKYTYIIFFCFSIASMSSTAQYYQDVKFPVCTTDGYDGYIAEEVWVRDGVRIRTQKLKSFSNPGFWASLAAIDNPRKQETSEVLLNRCFDHLYSHSPNTVTRNSHYQAGCFCKERLPDPIKEQKYADAKKEYGWARWIAATALEVVVSGLEPRFNPIYSINYRNPKTGQCLQIEEQLNTESDLNGCQKILQKHPACMIHPTPYYGY